MDGENGFNYRRELAGLTTAYELQKQLKNTKRNGASF